MALQSMLVINSRIEGVVYVNGRFAGELLDDVPLSMPVGPRGVLYVEHRPFDSGYIPLTRRITLAGGAPIAASIAERAGVSSIVWPCGSIELELTPERVESVLPMAMELELEGLHFRYLRDAACRVEVTSEEAATSHALPDGARQPDILSHAGRIYLTGQTDAGEMYVRVLSPDGMQPLLATSGKNVELNADGSVRALADLKDAVGHSRLMTWSPSEDSFALVSAETMWADGAPHWPETPQDTAIAAAEAILIGSRDEAEAYFVPSALGLLNQTQDAIRASGGVVKLRYPLPDGRQAIGLVAIEGSRSARVVPIYYHALPMGGSQGTWRLDKFEF